MRERTIPESDSLMLLKEKMQAADGRPSGFDYMRLILALFVLIGHSVDIVYGFYFGYGFWSSWYRAFFAMVLPMFFALSGFLVAGSLFRSKTLFSFLGLRVLRIVPALAFETVLCAFILGPVFTTLSLPEYFSGNLFRRYFLNIIGDPQFFLPGVFASNPIPTLVNLQLWTVPWEFGTYILVMVMSLVGIFRSRIYLIVFVLAFNIAFLARTRYEFAGFAANGVVLVESCLAAVVLFAFSDKLRHDWRLFVLSAMATFALFFTHEDYLAPFPLAYMTVYLGLLNPRRSKIVLSGDYSYGIYLYGFPIQQTVAHLGLSHGNWYLPRRSGFCHPGGRTRKPA